MSLSNKISSSFSGEQIASLLRTSGPIVSCVLLHAADPSALASVPNKIDRDDSRYGDGIEPSTSSDPSTQIKDGARLGEADGEDLDKDNRLSNNDDSTKKQNGQSVINKTCDSSNNDNTAKDDKDEDTKECKEEDSQPSSSRIILEEQMTEIKVDTTPKKSMVSQILGGPFTFLGQYESEGIVLMVRKQPDGVNDGTMENEVDGLFLNTHQLQPPLHNAKIYGDILIMRVAPSSSSDDEDDEDDNKDQNHSTNSNEKELTTKEDKPIELLSNEEFFQNYTKDEYIQFASRTDIVPLLEPSSEVVNDEDQEIDNEEEEEDVDGDDEEEEEIDDEDEEFVLGVSDEEDFDEDDEEAQIGMMNLLLAQVIKRFREENERGPTTEELLAIKSELGKKLGIDESILGGISINNDDDDEGNENKSSFSNDNAEIEEDNKTASAAEDEMESQLSKEKGKSKKRKSEESNDNAATTPNKAKKVKFTNKDHIKLIPAIEKKVDGFDDINSFEDDEDGHDNVEDNHLNDDENSELVLEVGEGEI